MHVLGWIEVDYLHMSKKFRLVSDVPLMDVLARLTT